MTQIRQATPEDATAIAPLIYDAIGEIANHLTNEHEPALILAGLSHLVTQTTNRHTYENTFVATENNTILGIIVLYDGKRGKLLDKHLEMALGMPVDAEAHDDEYYIDTICVAPLARSKGIGTKLLQFSEGRARNLGYDKLSLNVELEKKQAQKLYNRYGFVITEPWTITGEPFHHMVKQL